MQWEEEGEGRKQSASFSFAAHDVIDDTAFLSWEYSDIRPLFSEETAGQCVALYYFYLVTQMLHVEIMSV